MYKFQSGYIVGTSAFFLAMVYSRLDLHELSYYTIVTHNLNQFQIRA